MDYDSDKPNENPYLDDKIDNDEAGGDSAGDTNLPPPLQLPQEVDRTQQFQPGATSTPYQPPGGDGEGIELGNLDLDEMEFDPDDILLLTDFISEDDRQSAVDRTIYLI